MPAHTLSAAERDEVLRLATSPEFANLPPTQIVPLLADRGTYIASESTFYRVLRAEKLAAHRGPTRPRTHHRPAPLKAAGPNEVWSWDITYLRSPIKGRFYYLYMLIDVWSRKIVGAATHEAELSAHAPELARHAAAEEGISHGSLHLHSDNGGPMKGSTMLATLHALGIVPSFSRAMVSDDNAFSESLFRTLKYRPEYPRGAFTSLEAAQLWVRGFVHWYNNLHLHSAIRFVTPADRHSGADQEVLAQRSITYQQARHLMPARWTGHIRNWTPIETVTLNAQRQHVA